MNSKKPILNLDVWGGLGDNLQVSTIPRRFFEKYGYKGVYISNSVPWRNNEIKKLIWDKNPYIAGFTDKKGINIADTGLVQFDGTTNWIQNMEKIYKFDPPFNNRPEIYHDLTTKDVFNTSKSIIIDMSYSEESYKRNIERYPELITSTKNKLKNLLAQNNLNADIKIIHQPKHLNNINFFEKLNINGSFKAVVVENLFDYCNIIQHSKQYICSHSGCHALAAAIRKSCICFIPENYYFMKYFVFDNIKYITI